MELNQTFGLLGLGALLSVAVISDFKTRRIPNALILLGIAAGFIFQAVAFFDDSTHVIGAIGFNGALYGGLTGLAIFLPFYALKTFGAGDVKLLAMVGVWLGVEHILYASLWTLASGGVLALVFALGSGVLRQALSNIHSMVIVSLMQVQAGVKAGAPVLAKTTGRLPYAVAIASGTVIELAHSL